MMPEAIEHAAPTRKATPSPAQLDAEDVGLGHALLLEEEMTTPMTTAPTTASRPIVVYWRG
jgi:hypothetical protein